MVRGSPGALRLLSGASVLARGGGPLLRVCAAERWRRHRGSEARALGRSREAWCSFCTAWGTFLASARSADRQARSLTRARCRRTRPRRTRSPAWHATARRLPEVVSLQLDRRPVRRALRRVPPRLGIAAERPQVRDALLRHEPFERREPV